MNAKVLEKTIWLLVFAVIVGCGVWKFVIGDATKGFMAILTVALLVVLAIWQRYSKWPSPSVFIIMVYGFILVAMGLGTFGGFYEIFGFDDFLHFFSGIMAGYGAWIILVSLLGKELAKRIPNVFIGIYLISFALAVAGFWELLEFVGDEWFHFTAQRGHVDTMVDMIDGLVGGIVVCGVIVGRDLRSRVS